MDKKTITNLIIIIAIVLSIAGGVGAIIVSAILASSIS